MANILFVAEILKYILFILIDIMNTLGQFPKAYKYIIYI